MSSPPVGRLLLALSPKQKPLKVSDLRPTVSAVVLAARIRTRLKAELQARHLSHRQLMAKVNEQIPAGGKPWSQSKVAKVLNGHVELQVEDLEVLTTTLGLSLVELLREPGREFFADLRPSELRIVQLVRERGPEYASHLLLTVLPAAGPAGRRRALSDNPPLPASQGIPQDRTFMPGGADDGRPVSSADLAALIHQLEAILTGVTTTLATEISRLASLTHGEPARPRASESRRAGTHRKAHR